MGMRKRCEEELKFIESHAMQLRGREEVLAERENEVAVLRA